MNNKLFIKKRRNYIATRDGKKMIYVTDGREDSEDKSYNKTEIKGKEQET
jgi:hypothetical protein